MIKAIIKNLEKGIKLLENITIEEYTDTSVAPYYASIGAQMRHILDVFDCIFEGLKNNHINLAKRGRNEFIELNITLCLNYFNETIEALNQLNVDFDNLIKITDDLGLGEITQNYTIGSALIQAHGHAIHHFATLGYIIAQLEIELPDNDFGYNPTTPRKLVSG